MSKIYRTIIVDDEPPARTRLLKLLDNFPETFNVIEEALDGKDAKEKIEALQPDLIFLDIEMPELTGFQLLEELNTIPIVIFCTAYDQYSLKAFETNSIDYLVKPIRLERLQQSVNKLKLFSETSVSQNVIALLNELSKKKEEQKMTSITVKKGEKFVFVKLQDVSYFKAEERYVVIYTNNDSYLTEEPLSVLENKLPYNFLRVHRGIIINKDCVQDIQKYFNSRYIITLNDSKQSSVTTGRSYNEVIKKWIELY